MVGSKYSYIFELSSILIEANLNIKTMIIGSHAIIYSKNPQADRDFFSKVLKLTKVDIGDGWLIFGLPPSEVAVHPTAGKTSHELYLMCDDINSFVEKMSMHGIICSSIQNQGWGLLTELNLPGGGKIGVYQPKHDRPKPMTVKTPVKKRTISASSKKLSK